MSLALAVAVIGAIVYLVAPGTKATELARIAFFVGLFWLVYQLAGHGLALR